MPWVTPSFHQNNAMSRRERWRDGQPAQGARRRGPEGGPIPTGPWFDRVPVRRRPGIRQRPGGGQGGAHRLLRAVRGLPSVAAVHDHHRLCPRDNEKLHNDLVNSALGTFPIIGPQLRSQAHALTGSAAAIAIGSILLLYGAVGLGLATQSATNHVWNIPYVRWPPFLLRYLRAVAILVLLALSTIGSTVLTGFATLVSHGWPTHVLLLIGSLTVNFVLIVIAFKVMTAEPLTWRDVALGATLATLFWQVLQLIGSWYIGRELHHSSDTYGFFGIVIVLLTWIYLGAQVFLLAAEINVVQRYRLWPRSITQPPLTAADKEVFERLARMEIRRPEVRVDIGFTPEADIDPLAPIPDPMDHSAPESGAERERGTPPVHPPG